MYVRTSESSEILCKIMDFMKYLILCVICFHGYYKSANGQTEICQLSLLNRYDFRIQSGIFHTKSNFRLLPCAKECMLRTNCQSFNYHQLNLECELSSDTALSLPNQVVTSSGYLQSDISAWPQSLAGECAYVTCPANYKCTVLSSGNTVCLISECSAPPSESLAGYTSTEVGVRTNVTYTCIAGASMSGNPDITCKADGTWTSPQFSCITDCGVPPTLTNGVHSFTATTYGSTATYSCNAGYSLSAGTNPITCQASGSWETMGLSCIIVDCGVPPTIINGARTYPATTYNSIATYTCNSGYSMDINTNTITCRSTGSWTTITFSCVMNVPLDPCNGASGSGYLFEGRCYVLSADTKPWSDAVAQCQSNNEHLVDVTTAGESAHVKAIVQNAAVNTWIGGTDVVTEDTWIWNYTGAAFTYLDWWVNDPDGGTGQNCLGIWGTSYGSQWIDIGCTSSLRYICEAN